MGGTIGTLIRQSIFFPTYAAPRENSFWWQNFTRIYFKPWDDGFYRQDVETAHFPTLVWLDCSTKLIFFKENNLPAPTRAQCTFHGKHVHIPVS